MSWPDLTHLLKKAHTAYQGGTLAIPSRNAGGLTFSPRKCPHQEPTPSGAHRWSRDLACIIRWFAWSSVGKQAKGKKHTSKDSGSGPWGVCDPSQNQQVSLGQTRQGSCCFFLTPLQQWGCCLFWEVQWPNSEWARWSRSWLRAQWGLLVSRHVKVT